jgi:hypothetical protein
MYHRPTLMLRNDSTMSLAHTPGVSPLPTPGPSPTDNIKHESYFPETPTVVSLRVPAPAPDRGPTICGLPLKYVSWVFPLRVMVYMF